MMKRIGATLIALMLSALVVSTIAAQAAITLTNAGFESWTAGSPDGWVFDPPIAQESTTVHGGTSALLISGFGLACQTVTMPDAGVLTYSAWLNQSAANAIGLRIYQPTNILLVQSGYIPATGAWAATSITSTVVAGSVKICIGNDIGINSNAVDDLSLSLLTSATATPTAPAPTSGATSTPTGTATASGVTATPTAIPTVLWGSGILTTTHRLASYQTEAWTAGSAFTEMFMGWGGIVIGFGVLLWIVMIAVGMVAWRNE